MVAYFTRYLEAHASGMEPFVAATLTQLLARVVKAGWAEGGPARGAPGALVDLLARSRRAGDRLGRGGRERNDLPIAGESVHQCEAGVQIDHHVETPRAIKHMSRSGEDAIGRIDIRRR